MVTKKRGGNDVEVQEGWSGRVIPFELVQQTILKAESEAIRAQEALQAQYISDIEEIREGLTEEEKMSNVYNEEKNKFVNTKDFANQLNRLIISKHPDDISFYKKLKRVRTLINKEKDLKKEIKKNVELLHLLTKETIEKLTDDEVYMLLDLKWIQPLCTSLASLPNRIINDLVAKVKTLTEKYAVTYLDIEKNIKESEQSLSALIDDLVGDEFDMKGLKEFQTLLAVDEDGK